MMQYDFWHIRRYLRLQGSGEGEILPFAGPPLVIANVVSIPEPIWRTVVATALAHEVIDVFRDWKWQHPLSVDAVERVLPSISATVNQLSTSLSIVYPPELAIESLPDADTVLEALRALRDLLIVSINQRKAVETWTE